MGNSISQQAYTEQYPVVYENLESEAEVYNDVGSPEHPKALGSQFSDSSSDNSDQDAGEDEDVRATDAAAEEEAEAMMAETSDEGAAGAVDEDTIEASEEDADYAQTGVPVLSASNIWAADLGDPFADDADERMNAVLAGRPYQSDASHARVPTDIERAEQLAQNRYGFPPQSSIVTLGGPDSDTLIYYSVRTAQGVRNNDFDHRTRLTRHPTRRAAGPSALKTVQSVGEIIPEEGEYPLWRSCTASDTDSSSSSDSSDDHSGSDTSGGVALPDVPAPDAPAAEDIAVDEADGEYTFQSNVGEANETLSNTSEQSETLDPATTEWRFPIDLDSDDEEIDPAREHRRLITKMADQTARENLSIVYTYLRNSRLEDPKATLELKRELIRADKNGCPFHGISDKTWERVVNDADNPRMADLARSCEACLYRQQRDEKAYKIMRLQERADEGSQQLYEMQEQVGMLKHHVDVQDTKIKSKQREVDAWKNAHALCAEAAKKAYDAREAAADRYVLFSATCDQDVAWSSPVDTCADHLHSAQSPLDDDNTVRQVQDRCSKLEGELTDLQAVNSQLKEDLAEKNSLIDSLKAAANEQTSEVDVTGLQARLQHQCDENARLRKILTGIMEYHEAQEAEGGNIAAGTESGTNSGQAGQGESSHITSDARLASCTSARRGEADEDDEHRTNPLIPLSEFSYVTLPDTWTPSWVPGVPAEAQRSVDRERLYSDSQIESPDALQQPLNEQLAQASAEAERRRAEAIETLRQVDLRAEQRRVQLNKSIERIWQNHPGGRPTSLPPLR